MSIGHKFSRPLPVFQARLRQAILLSGKPQRDIAAAMGPDIHESTLSNWLAGRSRPNLSRLVALALALNTTPNYLLGWPERKKADRGRFKAQA